MLLTRLCWAQNYSLVTQPRADSGPSGSSARATDNILADRWDIGDWRKHLILVDFSATTVNGVARNRLSALRPHVLVRPFHIMIERGGGAERSVRVAKLPGEQNGGGDGTVAD